MVSVACIDIGTTMIKAVIRKGDGLIMEKCVDGDPNVFYDSLVDRFGPEEIYVTGSGERLLEEGRDYVKLNELEATAYTVRHLGLDEGLVINIGTGTSFTLLSDGGFTHLNGTGVGGGALSGLAERMLGITDPGELEALAVQGALEKVNIVIDDIYPEGLGWLAGDVTVANFGKSGGGDADTALGIHSLVTESIVSMVRALLFHSPVKNIVVCGGVTNNEVVKELFRKYSALFGFKTTYLDDPSYGTALGMLALVEEKREAPIRD